MICVMGNINCRSATAVFEPLIEFQLRLEDGESGYFALGEVLEDVLDELNAEADELLTAIFEQFGMR